MRQIMVATAVILLRAGSMSGQLCTSPPDSSLFPVREDQLTPEGAARGLQYFRETIPKLLRRARAHQNRRLGELYYIGYPNSVIQVQGYVLKLEALLAQDELHAAERALLDSAGPETAVSEGRRRFQVAQRPFCEFLASHHWVD